MGKDFEIVAYRGEALPVTTLATLIQQFTPYAELFRHSDISRIRKPTVPDLHCIAFYDRVGGERDDDDDDDNSDGDADDAATRSTSTEPAPKPKGAVYFQESMLAERPNGSLASMVQQAWSLVRASAAKRTPSPTPEPEPDCPGLVRELSMLRGQAWLVGYGDHSCMGVFAEFRNGELVHPMSLDEIYGEHDDYTAWPSQQWSAALGTKVDLDKLVARYFPDKPAPPLFDAERPDRPIPFDADRYVMGLSESI